MLSRYLVRSFRRKRDGRDLRQIKNSIRRESIAAHLASQLGRGDSSRCGTRTPSLFICAVPLLLTLPIPYVQQQGRTTNMLSGTITSHSAPSRVGDCSRALPAVACQNISDEVSQMLRFYVDCRSSNGTRANAQHQCSR